MLLALLAHPPDRELAIHVVNNATGDRTAEMVAREFGDVSGFASPARRQAEPVCAVGRARCPPRLPLPRDSASRPSPEPVAKKDQPVWQQEGNRPPEPSLDSRRSRRLLRANLR